MFHVTTKAKGGFRWFSEKRSACLCQDALGFALPGIASPMGCKDNLAFAMEHILQSICYSIMTKGFNSINWAFFFYINIFREADF